MIIELDISGLAQFLILGKVPGGDDKETVIGLSTVAYLSSKDPAHVFLPAGKWHDAAFVKGSSIQQEWPMWKVNNHFLDMMLQICNWDMLHLGEKERYELEKEAVILFLLCEKYGKNAWEGIS